MQSKIKVILIGGSSHSGKSTLAKALFEKLGAKCISTDSLARHPGRPWKEHPDLIPAHVREHYTALSVDALLVDVLSHYRNLWPTVRSIVESHLASPSLEVLIIEGSALLPALVSTLAYDEVVSVWLTGSDDFFREKIHQSSQYQSADVPEQQLIDKFISRTIQYNYQMMESIYLLNLPYLNVTQFNNLDDLLHKCLKMINLPAR